MRYFIGITPTEKIRREIVSFQKTNDENEYPLFYEPHITVKAPGGLKEDLEWVEKIKERLENFPCFSVHFDGIGTFEENGVVFLNPEPKAEIKALHKAILEVVEKDEEPEDKVFEDEEYNSHLTLAGISWGIDREQMKDIEKSAEKHFTSPNKFKVEFVRVYQRKDDERKYNFFLDIPLKC